MALSKGIPIIASACMTASLMMHAASVVNIEYKVNEPSPKTTKHLEIGRFEIHLEGAALIDYRDLETERGIRKARFVLQDVNISQESCTTIQNVNNSKGMGYTLNLIADCANQRGPFHIEFTYDPQRVKITYAVSDVINGNNSLIITLQDMAVLRALDTNHESILRLARSEKNMLLHTCC